MNGNLKLAWPDRFTTGDKAIDSQRQHLAAIIDELAEAIESGHTTSKIRNILCLLQYYAEWYAHREKLRMACLQNPTDTAHKTAHEQLIATSLAFRNEYAERGGKGDFAQRLHGELTQWLAAHIQRVDRPGTNASRIPANNPWSKRHDRPMDLARPTPTRLVLSHF